MSNKVGKMVDGQAGRDPPGPAGPKYRQHQKSIHPAIHVISSSPSIDFPLVALITRRGIQYVGSELATCESMVTKRCPSCDPEMPTSTANGDQKAPKTSQMATKMHPKWRQNGIQNVSIELESTFLIFLQILYRFGEPFGSHFGAESEEKHIQKCIRKSTPEKYVKSIQNNEKFMPK